ncbi:MAG: hypothetical protein JSS34_04135 [Proteobacteria bacterium]|nr:hypothetical protein [Pseudomonadota bacterium]
MERHEDALKTLEEGWEYYQKTLKYNPTTANRGILLNLLASVCFKKASASWSANPLQANDWSRKALEYLKEAYSIFIATHSLNHPEAEQTRKVLEEYKILSAEERPQAEEDGPASARKK